MRKEDLIISDKEYDAQRMGELNTLKNSTEHEDPFFAYELDPKGEDVKFIYSILPCRPYKTWQDARIAFINAQSQKVRLKIQRDFDKVTTSLERACVLMKFCLTLETIPDQFLRRYQIVYSPKVLSEVTHWGLRYVECEYKFIISTGLPIGEGLTNYGDIKNKIINLSNEIHSQVCKLLRQLESEWPSLRYKELHDNLQTICYSNNGLNL
jgi:hypothetical protein